jgi:DNA-binding MarR family transcriptional regulator
MSISVSFDTHDTQQSQPELEAYMLLRQVNSMMEIFNRYDLRGEGLTVPQFAILTHATPEGVPLSEISARMLCDNSNLTGIVDRLISKGLVERRPDPQDRRVSLICLTQAGIDKLLNIGPRHHTNVSRRMHSLSEKQVTQLRDILQVLHQSLEDGLEQEQHIQLPPGKQSSARHNGHNGHRLEDNEALMHKEHKTHAKQQGDIS